MKVFLIVMLVIIAVLIIGCVVLYFVGKKLQKKQEESQVQMEAASQTASILVIDKKRMKLKESGLPAVVLENTPKYLRRSKVPVVKAKLGPKIMMRMIQIPSVPDRFLLYPGLYRKALYSRDLMITGETRLI